jgi:gliding motility-associated-like protein
VYTFSPNSGQCATSANLSVTVGTNVTPLFNPIGTLCQGDQAPALPTASNNGINGTWNPSAINTATTGTATYTFAPNTGQCASGITLNVTVQSCDTVIYDFNGSDQFYTVPAGVTCLDVRLWGGGGGSADNSNGGYGGGAAFVGGRLNVTPGQVLTIRVGGGGAAGTTGGNTANGTSAYPNGGVGRRQSRGGGNGGGMSAIFLSNNPLAIAGAGGGGAGSGSTNGNGTNYCGGVGAAVGQNGTRGGERNGCAQGAGGCGGNANGTNNNCLTPASTFATGFVGGNGESGNFTYGGAGGGGGYAGGQGGASGGNNSGGGGGGSSFFSGSLLTSFSGNTTTAGNAADFFNQGLFGRGGLRSTLTAGNTGNAGQNGRVVLIVADQITPTFTNLPTTVCSQSTPVSLPTVSIEGITGSWTPSSINTTTSGTYTFNPTPGQCASSITLNVTVIPQTVPVFNPIGPLCQGDIAPPLQPISNNNVSGTWNPMNVNTAVPGSSVYTFTPAAGQCVSNATLSVTVNPQTVPTFSTIGPFCQGDVVPSLPATSTNAISGTWSPAAISTQTVGNSTYTFTPNTGQCASLGTVDITINAPTVPSFPSYGPYCQNSPIIQPILPQTSDNWISGTWNPAGISTSVAGVNQYVFSPSPNQCASPFILQVTVNAETTPVFNSIGPLCQGSAAPSLPATSTNNVNGTWIPATIITTNPGTVTYSFTPANGVCASATTMNVTVNGLYSGGIQNETICQGENFVFGGTVYSTSGSYPFTFQAITGCDSTVTLNLSVEQPFMQTIDTVICVGTSLLFGGQSFNQPGTYTVSFNPLTFCDSSYTINLSFSNPQADFTATPAFGCAPLSVNFQNASNATGPITAAWNFGNGSSAVGNSGTSLYSNPGTYSVSLTITDAFGCQSDVTVQNLVQVAGPPQAGFIAPSVIYGDEPFADVLDNSLDAVSWNYSLSDGSAYSVSDFTHTFIQPGIYTITQTVVNAEGCSDVAQSIIEVKPGSSIYIPNSFTPSDDAVNDVFRAYANGLQEFRMRIFNRWGEEIFVSEDVDAGWDGTYGGEDVQPGVYVYQVFYIDSRGTYKTVTGSVILVR